jgi:hypothetical protein
MAGVAAPLRDETANDGQNCVGCHHVQKQDCSCADYGNDGDCFDHEHVSVPPSFRGKAAPALFPDDCAGEGNRFRSLRRYLPQGVQPQLNFMLLARELGTLQPPLATADDQ